MLADPHSHADDAQPRTRHFELELSFDFAERCLEGRIHLALDRPAEGALDLDTHGLEILGASDAAGVVRFELSAPDTTRGTRLRLTTRKEALSVRFRTGREATALQWLSPAQTQGKRLPYVFTQCQAIHARSIFPCQDTPRVRSTYAASLEIPAELQAVMAAGALGTDEAGAGRKRARFYMPQPIPSYLFAFAVGNLAKRPLGPRSAVFAEPETLEAAAWEFAGVDRMLTTAESLFGPYDWERFDLLVMPPSFPYGGMENPRLTFLTPSLLAQDRSLVNVVAHELAHSWTGNLVTNASMNDFWLNEGFTVYAERRILEALEGEEALALHAALGRKHLEVDLERLRAKDPALTRLRNQLEGVHPDDVYSLVPYEKGYLFLVSVERALGRPRFDRLLKAYLARFRFQSITTDDFLAFLTAEAPQLAGRVDVRAWIDEPGIPPGAPAFRSSKLEEVEALVAAWTKGERPSQERLSRLDANEWQVLLSSLPRKLPLEDCDFLEKRFGLSARLNAEIRVAWLSIAAASGYQPADAAVEDALGRWGRMKYLRPLYAALAGRGPEGKALAARIFAAKKEGYHPVAQAMVQSLL